ncbi:bifunctional Aminoacyl-tRNA synthetase [Babesia duncani]|uniref:serine--tRNA ligase n=1 Tax=Babesia duncani TaxID=323732 RepID=A0AAD9UMH1_9APIC|nr:bifunctional Aminoacyl-tRNA synthetase [Babesia duncani]KAK2194665.1 bifunctional Aminoacyl-tRNA synthetase [Babesia duncani]KAK2194767.1 bifunctional Aminoacyl-tRNA synthetase [Babesia duncani]KAK2195128.1 bifunctional Aminoacyl-tRNA synthetase [Babesia duncani]
MVIDIKYFRDAKLLEILRASERRRCVDTAPVDRVIAIDDKWRRAQHAYEQAKKNLNDISKQVAACVKNKQTDIATTLGGLKLEIDQVKQTVATLEQELKTIAEMRQQSLRHVGNIVDESVPATADEECNEVLRTFVPQEPEWYKKHPDENAKVNEHGILTPGFSILSHADLLEKIGGVDLKVGGTVAGHRGYYLKGRACQLSMALIQYGMNFLIDRGYEAILPPYFMRKDIMAACAELADFEETLYCIPQIKENEDNSLFLIATSEQPICALHINDVCSAKTLPRLYAGVSTCFRREAGAHGKDLKGIFRIHQFQKVEQLVVTTAQESQSMHEKMIEISQDFYKSLGLPYRVVCIVAGALNKAAAKKYDLEAWFPEYKGFRELVSCSNCTDFQARDLNARYFTTDTSQRTHVHMLNGTLVAIQRCLCCILENYQTPNGIVVPSPLVPYMNGVDFIPFVA